jgi:hypothetical protein
VRAAPSRPGLLPAPVLDFISDIREASAAKAARRFIAWSRFVVAAFLRRLAQAIAFTIARRDNDTLTHAIDSMP